MEQHPVPQDVTTFQFRLIGDMTLKQFGYLAVGLALAYIFYKLPLPFFITWPLAIGVGLTGFGFAFVPIEDRPMDVWVLSFFKNIYSPTQYVWQKELPIPEGQSLSKSFKFPTIPLPQPPKWGAKPHTNAAPQPAAHAKLQTTGALPAQTAHHAPAPTPPHTAPIHPHGPKRSLGDIIGDIFHPHTTHGAQLAPAIKPPQHHVTKPVSPPKPQPQTTPHPPHAPQVAQHTPQKPGVHAVAGIKQHAHKKGLLELIADMFHRPTAPSRPILSKDTHTHPDVFANVQTPNITGRRIDITPPPVVKHVPQSPAPTLSTQATTLPEKKLQPNIDEKLAKLQEELKTKSLSEDRVLELQKQLTEALSERQKIEHELLALRQKVARQETNQRSAAVQPVQMASPTVSAQPRVKIFSPEAARSAGIPRLTTYPNVVTGIIKDHEGTLLPGILVTVRDHNDVPMRALKTNKLGQFAASTPLPNGTYLVEIEDPRTRFSFDRVQITLTGGVIPALEIIAKSQKELTRAKLEKELFGNPSVN